MFDNLFRLTEEADFADGAVRRSELDVAYPESDPVITNRAALEAEVYAKTSTQHRYVTAKGERAIVWFDKRGRACSGPLGEMTDGELEWVAQTLDVTVRPETANTGQGSEAPAAHGYITPVTEDLAAFGFDPEAFITEGREELAEAHQPGTDPFDGPPPDMNKIKKFADMLQSAIDAHFKKNSPGLSRSDHYRVSISKRRKFVAVDIGTSGKFLVGPNDYVWGIKGYGRVHKGRCYGTLDAILQGGMTFMYGDIVRVTPGQHESIDVPVFDGVPWDHLVEYKPKSHTNSNWTQADSERFQSALSRDYVDMAAYDRTKMSDTAMQSALERAYMQIAHHLQSRADGVSYVRDPEGMLDETMVAAKVREHLYGHAMRGYKHGTFDSNDFQVTTRRVNGKTGAGLMVKMKKPFWQIVEKGHKGRIAG